VPFACWADTVRRTAGVFSTPRSPEPIATCRRAGEFTMTRPRSLRWLLACSVATSMGIAHAGPEECLTLRDNIAVAGCADRFAPGAAATTSPSTRHPNRPTPQPVQMAERWLLFPVPPAVPHTVAAKRETPEVIAERDRSELIRRSEVGAIGLAAMGMAFGVWRWRVAAVKSCSFCGTRISPGAAVCKRCFRSV